MKKIYKIFSVLCLMALSLIPLKTIAQPMLYGLTSGGGSNNLGTIFKSDFSGTLNTVYSYTSSFNGSVPKKSELCETSNGLMYGMTSFGGANNLGVLFEYNPTTNIYTKKLDFDGTTNGSNPNGSLMLASNGKLYGMTTFGGFNNMGVLFEYDPPTNTFIKILDFNALSGAWPYGSLTQASNGLLYGMTYGGGVNNGGVLFEYDPTTNSFIKKLDFTSATGAQPNGSLMQAGNGLLYGMTAGGGTNNKGVLFEYNTTSDTYTKKIDLSSTIGSQPNGSLIQAGNGLLYGMTNLGGTNNKGVLFEYNTSSNTYTKKLDFDGTTNGSNPSCSLMQANNGLLYGMTYGGGASGMGVLFEYNTTSNIYTKKLDFYFTPNGSNPYGSLMQASNGLLYGMTSNGGANSNGVLFEFNPITSAYAKKFDFNNTINGTNPYGSLMQASNGLLYGMTTNGGVNSKGTLFEYNPTTSTYTKTMDFDGTINGSNPNGSLMQAGNGLLYGMTGNGGVNDKGVLFEYNPTTNTYTKKLDFDGTATGANPYGSLMQASNGLLYGMTASGGVNYGGVLFEYNPTTNTFIKKMDFSSTTGMQPRSSLIQANNGLLYGMTYGGGSGGMGVLFEYNPTTNIYTKKLNFNGAANGAYPYGSLIQASNGLLYGTTSLGGVNNKGVLFEYNPTTDIYTKKLDFDANITGSEPKGALMQASNGLLYGMTSLGGVNDKGVLFEYNIISNVYTKKLDFNGGGNGGFPYSSLIEVNTTPTSIHENGLTNSNSLINIYPNPTNGILNIETKENIDVKIINMLGETLAIQKLQTGNNTIDVRHLVSGIYFIQIGNKERVKFIKE